MGKSKKSQPPLTFEEQKARTAALAEAKAAARRVEEAERRERDFRAVGLPNDASGLASNATVQVRRNGQRQTLSARRLDVFDMLRKELIIGAFDAVRRLETDLAIERGEHDRGRPDERVDGYRPGDRTDDMLAAKARVIATRAAIGALDGALIIALLEAPLDRDWRETVLKVTGERNPVAQATAVRMACANLALAYRLRMGRRAA